MKIFTWFILLSLFIPLTLTAQDLLNTIGMSNFFQVSVFRLPSLRGGQFAISVTPRYTSAPGDNGYFSSSPTGSTLAVGNSTSHLFRIGSSFLCGLSDRTTFSLTLDCAPAQSTGDINSITSFSSPAPIPPYIQTISNRQDYISSTLIVAHRFRPNIELSATATYSNANYPSTGTTVSQNTANTLLQSGKSRNFDIQASIVIVSN